MKQISFKGEVTFLSEFALNEMSYQYSMKGLTRYSLYTKFGDTSLFCSPDIERENKAVVSFCALMCGELKGD